MCVIQNTMESKHKYTVVQCLNEIERTKLQNIFRLRNINTQFMSKQTDKLLVYFKSKEELSRIRNILAHYSFNGEDADNITHLSLRQRDMLIRTL